MSLEPCPIYPVQAEGRVFAKPSQTAAEDGPTVRFLSALAAPVFPLVALLCCFLVELLKPGLGIAAALQAVHISCSTDR